MPIILQVTGAIIILGLSAYAGYLWFLVYQQKKAGQQQAQEDHIPITMVDEASVTAKKTENKEPCAGQKARIERNKNIISNVKVFTLAAINGQCDLSEASIRIHGMLSYLQGKEKIDVDGIFPAISELNHITKDMARGDERDKLPKQERMKQNLTRKKAEARLQDDINQELDALKKQIEILEQELALASETQD